MDEKNGFAVLKNITNNKSYAFYYAPISTALLGRYANTSIGGEPVIDHDTIENYVNENLLYLKKGTGVASWDSGQGDLVEIDQPLREKLQQDFSGSSSVLKALR